MTPSRNKITIAVTDEELVQIQKYAMESRISVERFIKEFIVNELCIRDDLEVLKRAIYGSCKKNFPKNIS